MRKNQRLECLVRRSALALGVGAALFAVACKPKGGDSTKAASSAEPVGSAGGSGEACAEYATKLCDEAGKESPTCQAVRTATDLMPAQACRVALKDVDFAKKKLAEKGKACTELVQKLCAEIGPATEACKMVTTQTKNFPPERCTTMLEHIPEIVAELKKEEDRNKPLSPEKQAMIAAGTAPSFGPATSKVTLVEFSDFECPYCSKAALAVSQVKKKYGDKVRFIFRQFPLNFHKNARGAAEASLAAHAQGKFWEFHDRLFENQSALDRPSLEKHAQAVGLDMKAFKKALDSAEYGAVVDADLKLGAEAAVEGTPSLFVNGARVANPSDFDTVSKLVDDALKAAEPG